LIVIGLKTILLDVKEISSLSFPERIAILIALPEECFLADWTSQGRNSQEVEK